VVSHVTEVVEGVHRLTNGVANFYLIEEAGAHSRYEAVHRGCTIGLLAVSFRRP
jgi:hypothetical protein